METSKIVGKLIRNLHIHCSISLIDYTRVMWPSGQSRPLLPFEGYLVGVLSLQQV